MNSSRTRGVFSELQETRSKKASWDMFISDITRSPKGKSLPTKLKRLRSELTSLARTYQDLISDSQTTKLIERLVGLETRMLQLHCLLTFEVAFSSLVQRKGDDTTEYIIARAPFHLPDQKRQEVRIYMGKMSDYPGKTLKQLQKDEGFISMAEEKVREHMLSLIQKQSTNG